MNEPTSIASWYSLEFITNSLIQYFRNKGFRVVKDEQAKPIDNNIIVFTKLLSKERIEIKGVLSETNSAEIEQLYEEKSSGLLEVVQYFLDIMLSPISFFSSEEERSICVPGTQQHKEVLEKLYGYFVTNRLQLKVYVVNEDGSVDFMHLKRKKSDGH